MAVPNSASGLDDLPNGSRLAWHLGEVWTKAVDGWRSSRGTFTIDNPFTSAELRAFHGNRTAVVLTTVTTTVTTNIGA